MLTPQKWEVIAGRYRLVREMARGGMGSVWEGKDDKLKRKVAIKLLAPELHGQTDALGAREQFEREAMAIAQLQSPHVVQIFDYGVERECPFIVMEMLEGEDLRSRLHRHKRLPLETAAVILVQTAKALSVAHAAGIVHRDLKPGNIFLVRTEDEEIAKVLDFGVAMHATDLLEHDGDTPVLGTPQFMSPEQARGLADLDHRADLWSLGVIVYKALTGRLPFTGGSPTDVIVRVCTADPEPVSQLAPDLPRELDAFFDRALSRDRRRRFGSAREMALAFSRISPVTFTTMSMPDPVAIEAAIAAARHHAAAIDSDDEAATVVVDPATIVHDGGHALEDDLKTSVVIPKGLPLPTPPPRRSSRAETQAPKVIIAAAEDSDPLTLALDYEDDLPTSVAIEEAHTSSPVLLSKTPDDDHLTSDTPPAVVGRSRHAAPVVAPRKGTQNALLMAFAAALLGVGVAFIGTQMTGDDQPAIVEGTAVAPPDRPRVAAPATSTQKPVVEDEEEVASVNASAAETDEPSEPSPRKRRQPTAAPAPVVSPEPAPVVQPAPAAPPPEPVAPAPEPVVPAEPVPAPPPAPVAVPKPPEADPFAERL